MRFEKGKENTSQGKETNIVPVQNDTKEQLVTTMGREKFLPLELREDQMQEIEKIKSGLDLSDVPAVIDYGGSAQEGIIRLSESISGTMRAKDLGEIGKILTDTSVALQDFDEKSLGGNFLTKLFYSGKKMLTKIITDYKKTDTVIKGIENSLDSYMEVLKQDVQTQDKLAEENMKTYEQLSLYYIAGQEALVDAKQQLEEMKQQSDQIENYQFQQEIKDKSNEIDRFERKLDDIKRSAILSLQIIPQIRLMQDNAYALAEKLKNAKVVSLPAWRNQMILALGIINAENAVKFGDNLDKATNKILVKNSEMIKTSSVAIATAKERSFVDLDTIKTVMTNTINTVSEVQNVVEKARKERSDASHQLDKGFAEFMKQLNFVSNQQNYLNS